MVLDTMYDYLQYFLTTCEYLSYFVYAFVFLTLLPKSINRIKRQANAENEVQSIKYHRCYGPEHCCHVWAGADAPKPKPRKTVTRVYPKKNASSIVVSSTAEAERHSIPIKRQVQPSSIQTQTNVNQIAQMFENSAVAKKINRVTPTLLSEFRATENVVGESEHDSDKSNYSRRSSSRLSQYLNENIENAVNRAKDENYRTAGQRTSWHVSEENMLPPVVYRRKQTIEAPIALNYLASNSSATPSTVSPAASSPFSSSPISRSPSLSPTPRLSTSFLNLKSSLEDIFAAIAKNAEKTEHFFKPNGKTLSPVTSIDDILSQRRLSRPLSAYSISDLLMNE